MASSRAFGTNSYMTVNSAIRTQLNGCAAFSILAWGIWNFNVSQFYPFSYLDTSTYPSGWTRDWGLYPYSDGSIYCDYCSGTANIYGVRSMGHNPSVVTYTVGQICFSGSPVHIYRCIQNTLTGTAISNTSYWRDLGVNTSVWIHFGLTFNGLGSTNADKLKLYLNGIYHSFSNFNGTVPSSVGTHTTEAEIGRINSTGNVRYNGSGILHGPTHVYRKELTQAQIQEQIYKDKANFGSQIGYWDMRSNTTTSGTLGEKDLSGTGSNCTLAGSSNGTLSSSGPRI